MRNKILLLCIPFLFLGFFGIISCEDEGIGDNNETGPNKDNIEYGSITDIDGNTYKTVKIGNQEWMAENLAVTHFNDGTEIPTVFKRYEPDYLWYDDDETTNKPKYGALYNFYSATGNVCPTGWHVPTDVEWTELQEYLIANKYNYDGTTIDNKIAKSLSATYGWNSSTNEGAIGNNLSNNNSTGFNALPGGFGSISDHSFSGESEHGDWWSSTGKSLSYGWGRNLEYDYRYLYRDHYSKMTGLSIRCLKDY